MDLPDGVNVIVTSPSIEFRKALIRIVDEVGGIKPQLKSDSEDVKRAHYAPARYQLILNASSHRMRLLLGRHAVTLAIKVEDRIIAAHQAVTILAKEGFQARIHTHAEPSFPDGFIVFVSIEDSGGIMVMFWPTDKYVASLPEKVRDSFPKREPWTDDDLK